MPRNRVINRRNVHPLEQRSLSVTDEAVQEIKAMARRLEVSQGSLVDVALRELSARSDRQVAELLWRHKHLTDDEYEYVRAHLGGRRKPGGKGS